MRDIEPSPANRPWRDYMEHEARPDADVDREFAVRRMCGPRATKSQPLPLPVPTDEQIARFARQFYRRLVGLQQSIGERDSGVWSLVTVNEWLATRRTIEEAAAWRPEEEAKKE